MHHDLTNGNITRSLLWFAFPIMVGNLLQQFYNVVDTLKMCIRDRNNPETEEVFSIKNIGSGQVRI